MNGVVAYGPITAIVLIDALFNGRKLFLLVSRTIDSRAARSASGRCESMTDAGIFVYGFMLRRIELAEAEPDLQHPPQRLVDVLLGQQAFGEGAGMLGMNALLSRSLPVLDRGRRRFLERRVLHVRTHHVFGRAAVGDDKPLELPLVRGESPAAAAGFRC